MMTFTDLRMGNVLRDQQWDPEKKIDLAFRATELGGETGEALNVVKKLLREKLGLRGTRATTADLATELADIVICVDLLAMTAEIDLEQAVRDKFNDVSRKRGLTVFLED